MAEVEIKVPDIGDFKNIPIIEILVKPGDMVKADDPLISLESDKATMEVPAPSAGRVAAILVKVGDKVSEGVPFIRLEAEAGAAAAPAAATPAPVAPAAAPAASKPASAAPSAAVSAKPAPEHANAVPVLADFGDVYASPSVRRLARELDVDLRQIKGSGEKGRVTKEDVKAALAGSTSAVATGGSGIPEIPAVDFAKFGPVETRPMSRIKRLSGPHLHRSWLNIPHVTHNDEADITQTEAFRKDLDDKHKADKANPLRISLLPFLMKAAVNALQAFPDFNASLAPTKDALIYKQYYHIGIAVDTPDGLVVPVVRDVNKKGILDISRELADISARARIGKLKGEEMQGGTFSISSLGGIGGTAFTPIVNAPEVAILGVVRSKMAPVWDGTAFQPRLMLPLCLSYDHRVIDGASAARFTRYLVAIIEDLRRLAL
ncbi:MAG: dihydrolipoyllysine-residue acetyltransferase [Hyphomicrobiales bacterium]|nr:dihydrolipoyllysine-residue acetyltransferase [Hyphomicrobiales bacterium]MDE2114814.1 dihydrolipoyllysine-residue acetyltransferase [Hyphomicrobiales bacterium]